MILAEILAEILAKTIEILALKKITEALALCHDFCTICDTFVTLLMYMRCIERAPVSLA